MQAREDAALCKKQSVTMSAEQTCAICRKRIGSSAFAVYPHGTKVHFVCFQQRQMERGLTSAVASGY